MHKCVQVTVPPSKGRSSSRWPDGGAVFTLLFFQPCEDVPAGGRQRGPSEGWHDRSGDVWGLQTSVCGRTAVSSRHQLKDETFLLLFLHPPSSVSAHSVHIKWTLNSFTQLFKSCCLLSNAAVRPLRWSAICSPWTRPSIIHASRLLSPLIII